MNKIIIPTGYMGSGSSAITDLLSEYDGYEAENGSFEYVFLHCPNGVFDLEDKLLNGNNAVRSDEALDSFLQEMQELFERKLWWPGNYKEKLSPRFMEYTMDYVEDLTEFKLDYYWYYQEKLDAGMFMKLCLRKILRMISAGHIVLKRPLTHTPMRIAIPDPEVFYEKTKKYLERLFEEMGIRDKNLILDQLLLPFNLHRMKHYFGDNVECFVVQRDPRDVFISNKYVWKKMDCPVPYPIDPMKFCRYYRKLREMYREIDNPHIHLICFEDLIYNYEETVSVIEKALGLSGSQHKDFQKCFDPSKSIQNTQLFRKKEYREEMQILERELKEYLYEFPYEREVCLDKAF